MNLLTTQAQQYQAQLQDGMSNVCQSYLISCMHISLLETQTFTALQSENLELKVCTHEMFLSGVEILVYIHTLNHQPLTLGHLMDIRRKQYIIANSNCHFTGCDFSIQINVSYSAKS